MLSFIPTLLVSEADTLKKSLDRKQKVTCTTACGGAVYDNEGLGGFLSPDGQGDAELRLGGRVRAAAGGPSASDGALRRLGDSERNFSLSVCCLRESFLGLLLFLMH